MKTNVSIELNDEQRLNLGQKYHNTKAKKLISRKDINDIVLNFIHELINSEGSARNTAKRVVERGEWVQIYYYNGRRISKQEYETLPNGPRKFYGFEEGGAL